MFDAYQQFDYSLWPRKAHCTESLCQSVVVIYVENECLAVEETGTVTCLQDGYQGSSGHQSYRYHPNPRQCLETCALAILKTFLTQEETILAHAAMCGLLLPKYTEATQDSPDFFLKAQYDINKSSNNIHT